MDRMRTAALLTRLMEELHKNGSWCGETHVQKVAFFAQELTEIPMNFDFILYKHGPFSFGLRDEITSLRADGLVKLKTQWLYGPQLLPTERSHYVQSLYPKTLKKYEKNIEFVTQWLGDKDVGDLERIGTAFYIIKFENKKVSVDERATRLTDLKPHISREDAINAIKTVNEIVTQVQNQIA